MRPGYIPPDEMPRYKAPRPERWRGEIIGWRHGYGFVKPDDLGSNVFVHHSEVRATRDLRTGDLVEFERREADPDADEKVARALNVRLVEELPPPMAAAPSLAEAASAAVAPVAAPPVSSGATARRTAALVSDASH